MDITYTYWCISIHIFLITQCKKMFAILLFAKMNNIWTNDYFPIWQHARKIPRYRQVDHLGSLGSNDFEKIDFLNKFRYNSKSGWHVVIFMKMKNILVDILLTTSVLITFRVIEWRVKKWSCEWARERRRQGGGTGGLRVKDLWNKNILKITKGQWRRSRRWSRRPQTHP